MAEVSKEQIESFLNGSNPQERIIKIEGDYNDSKIHVIYRDEDGKMRIEHDDFYPFVWCKLSVCTKLYNGNRETLKQQMRLYGIKVKALRTNNSDGITPERMENGFRFMFYAQIPMSYTKFLEFFENGGCPVYGRKDDSSNRVQEFIAVSNTEQYMISTGKRLFKGYNDYDDLLRLTWDLETEGLDPHVNAISQIGIRTNKGYQKIITIEGDTQSEKFENEIKAIDEFFRIIREINPDVITGHNTENFDWNFISVRLELAGTSMKEFTKDYFNGVGIYKKNKQAVLKLGGEMEYYFPTVFWGHNVTDSLQAVRRAQALDSSMKKADLKYVSAYSKIKKKNRVYIKGKLIDETWLNLNKVYAFNDDNGNWFKTEPKTFEKTFTNSDGVVTNRYTFNGYDSKLIDNQTNEEFEFVTGRYIAERYLLDDLWEGDRVEHRYNGSNFLVGKMLPISFEKTCTTGTAALWKYILMGWSYENGLALPDFTPRKSFTGGLSRLLTVGYVDRVVKLDYNSLYPSIILTYGIETNIDIMGVMSAMLEYVLTQRELYKGLKAEFGGKSKKMRKLLETMTKGTKEYAETEQKMNDFASESASNDKKQLPLKILGNSYFGAFGSGDTSGFNWSDIDAAEETTCCGRQSLRLMISHFVGLGYKPIVGDSFTGDTPLFVKYNDSNLIDIKTIAEMIDEDSVEVDVLGREYDYSKKNYKVLCRSGWCEPSYIYRHKTSKPIYTVSEGEMSIDVTEDHSLFTEDKKEIKPSQIKSTTKLEYFNDKSIYSDFNTVTQKEYNYVSKTYGGTVAIMNADKLTKKIWFNLHKNDTFKTKKDLAVFQFIKNSL
jgi:DNA polymerase|nr:MAG TPA: DNA polymerase [Ackermannviridae sp.]